MPLATDSAGSMTGHQGQGQIAEIRLVGYGLGFARVRMRVPYAQLFPSVATTASLLEDTTLVGFAVLKE